METNHSLEDALEGILFLYSETGTEGGYWAFQESKYIQKDVPMGYCKNCGIYMREQKGSIKIDRVYNLDEVITNDIEDLPVCKNDEHEEYIGDSWEPEGFNILKDGDHLTIYHPDDNKEVWSGVINLKQYNRFTEDASGVWIHADQIGIERDVWAEYFFQEYSAKLIPLDKHK